MLCDPHRSQRPAAPLQRRGSFCPGYARPRPPRWLVAALALVLATLFAGPTSVSAASLRQIGTDPYTNITSQHRTAVEPDTFAFGSTIVSAFQVGRFTDGGASNIGWATSTDGGTTWTDGTLPGLTTLSSPAGTAGRASDPSVSYDSMHQAWMITSLTLSGAGGVIGIVVSRSLDGLTWDVPVGVAASSTFDKDWIVCDNGGASPFRGRCYVSWDDFVAGKMLTSTSLDGGLTWGPPIPSADNAGGVGVQPLVQPNGTLIITALGNGIVAIRSSDGGASFGPKVTVSSATAHAPTAMRTSPLPSAEVDAAGRVYVAWQDCRFRAGCRANDIVMSTSSDGITWSAVARVPIDAVDSRVDHFIPGLAVDRQTSGAGAHIGLVYYYFPVASCKFADCQLNVGFISSDNAGVSWRTAKQVNTAAMAIAWLPDTNQGRMVGDYISASFVNGGVVAAFALASAPSGPVLQQAMYADWEGGPVTPSVGGVAEQLNLSPSEIETRSRTRNYVGLFALTIAGLIIIVVGGLWVKRGER